MRIVSKDNERKILDAPFPMDVVLKDALQRCFVTRNASRADYAGIQRILSFARQHNAWLECQCKGPLVSFLFPRKLQSGSYTVVRPATDSAHSHAAHCPFFSMPQNQEDEGVPDFNVLGKGLDDEHDIRARLYKVLKFLLLQASMCHYDSDNYSHPYQVLGNVKEQLQTIPLEGSKLNLANIVQTYDRYLVSFFKSLNNHLFPEGMAKQGFYWGLATQVHPKAVTLASGRLIELDGTIHNPTSDQGPCWVLLLYSEATKGFYKAFHSIALPAYSEKLPILLSASDERPMLKQLLSVALNAKKADRSVVISKPFDKRGMLLPGLTLTSANTIVNVAVSSKKTSDIAYDAFETDKDFRESINQILFKDH